MPDSPELRAEFGQWQKLGEGGFGPVFNYKGTRLRDGKVYKDASSLENKTAHRT